MDGLVALLRDGPWLVTRPLRVPLRDSAELGPLQLEPGQTLTFSLRTRWETREEVTGSLPSWLPLLERGLGDPLELEHPDAALVAPPGLAVSGDGQRSQVDSPVAGDFSLSLHHAAGESVLPVCWAGSVAEAVGERAVELLAAAPRRQGVAVLPDPAAALLVARGEQGQVRDEAVALALAELMPDPWSVLLAVEEHQRDPSGGSLTRAVELLARLGPGAGAATAAVATLIACATAGQDPAPAAAALARWQSAWTVPAGGVPDAHPDPPESQAELLRLEAGLLAGQLGPGSSFLVDRLVDRLGAGLPGRALSPVPGGTARTVSLLRALPEAEAVRLLPRLVGAERLADVCDRAERRLLVARPSTTDLAWLGTTVLSR